MNVRDRIKCLKRVAVKALRPNPRNWRLHPLEQRKRLKAMLEEVGMAGALLARELPDGELELIDGHLRAEELAGGTVPVLILDVNEEEALKLLATFDPLGEMAKAESEAYQRLCQDFNFQNQTLDDLYESLKQEYRELSAGTSLPNLDPPKKSKERQAAAAEWIPGSFQVSAECGDEARQKELYERLTQEGYRCRLLTL